MRCALLLSSLTLAVTVTACPKPRAVLPPPTVDQQIMAATNYALECMSSAGVDCLADSDARDGWSAQGDLELVTQLPLALLPTRVQVAAADLTDGRLAIERVVMEARRAEMRARDLSCRAVSVRYIGGRFIARRDQLSERARWLGLPHTTAAAAITALITATVALDRVRLVEANCDTGKVYALVEPPTRKLAADDDPEAYDGGGWQVFAASDDAARLIDGYLHPPRPRAAPLSDAAPVEFVHPWLPITEVDL